MGVFRGANRGEICGDGPVIGGFVVCIYVFGCGIEHGEGSVDEGAMVVSWGWLGCFLRVCGFGCGVFFCLTIRGEGSCVLSTITDLLPVFVVVGPLH